MAILPPFQPATPKPSERAKMIEYYSALNEELRNFNREKLREIKRKERLRHNGKEALEMNRAKLPERGINCAQFFESKKYCINSVSLDPGKKIQLHRHLHRRERLVVVSGVASVTLGDRTFLVQEAESVSINFADWHSIQNPGKALLTIIEVQCGNISIEKDTEYFLETTL